jgi:hypothetical protein
MIIIGLTGPAGCGKDTAAKYLCEKYNLGWRAFADPLRAALNAMFGWDELNWEDREWRQKPQSILGGQTPRRAIQTLGTEWGRDLIDPDLWVNLTKIDCEVLRELGYKGMVVSDVRFPNEVEWIREVGTLIHIVRDVKEKTDVHVSENGVALQLGDLQVHNTSTIDHLHGSLDLAMTIIENWASHRVG